ncbi:IclR family transcriptional regulator [Bradyrhizobium diazoefficiens]|uniref:IclR family transcriptional regulator n=1 Tax=Bradyrhizobium diazoefficiens TaxID=1355477 RepID=UPI00190B60E1|nr:IclR family transcriptional regulator [Bradyrhizobium diazoefficiens]QQO13876.1 IclR family transcriptional regulator [Bradyrhizobium diazoefficiens]
MKTVRTAIQLLTIFSSETPAVTVSAAAARFGLTASGSSRLLASMAASGLIQQGPDRAYRPGPLAYKLGLLYHSHNRLAELVNQGARKIVLETGLSCWVSVLTGTEVMLISRFPGQVDQGFHVDAGNLLPCNASAAGKALLARMPADQARKLLSSGKLPVWTKRTKTDLPELLVDLANVRERGWSIIVEELFLGLTSVAVALSAPTEPTPMALSISMPSGSRGANQVVKAIVALRRSAIEIAGMIGDEFWATRTPASDTTTLTREVKKYIGHS